MRRRLAFIRILGHGRALRLLLWPVLSAACVFIIGLAVLTPLFGQLEQARAHATPEPSPTASPAPPDRAHPDFSIAVGIDDQAQEMPAIQSAMTDYLAFSDEFFTRLEQGGIAPDFSTKEQQMSPESARAQVKDGTSVLAVVLPTQLTRQIIKDIRAVYLGEIDAPSYTITVVAGPQAMNDDGLIVKQYEDQVIRQAIEHISKQIRTVAGKHGCPHQGVDAAKCPVPSEDVEVAFERPIDITVEEVSGPEPVDYFADSIVPGAVSTSPQSSDTDPSSEATSSPATPAATSVASGPSASGPSALAWLAAVLSALILANLTLTLTTSFIINRAAGLQVVVIGPWRSMHTQRPLPRKSLLGVKLAIAVTGAAALALLATLAVAVLNHHFGLLVGAYPALRLIAVAGFFWLLSTAVASLAVTTGDVLGSVFGILMALALTIWGIAASGLATLLGITAGGVDLARISATLLGGNRSMIVELVGPLSMIMFAAIALTIATGHVVTGIYDRRTAKRIAYREWV